jgi:glycosyltransferase involved in cell wall biosynthesis
MKVAVYSIAKNEAKHVRRWAESAKDADELVIVDTGSTDDTVKIAKSLGIKVYKSKYKKFAFDKARNEALDHISDDVDYCVSLDLDEILHHGWREKLEQSVKEQPNANRFWYTFINTRLPGGSAGQSWARNLIHKRYGSRWQWPIHEILATDDLVWGTTKLTQEHLPDRSKPRSSYMPLLEQAVKDMPEDSRMSFYYGRELFYYSRGPEAVEELKHYLTLEGSWSYERSEAMLMIGKCSEEDRESWFLKACAETPDRREPFVSLAALYYEENRWQPALGAACRALDMTERLPHYITEEYAWGALPYDIAMLCALNIGAYELSCNYGREALRLSAGAEQQRILSNLEIAQRARDGIIDKEPAL